MAATLPPALATGLERSCSETGGDRLRSAPSRPGLERATARFAGRAFAPHRHDTYAIGLTLQGVQSFGYRGTTLHCRAGQVFVLHPDELHDGRAGTAEGFAYQILYIDPDLVARALGGSSVALPFVRTAVATSGPLLRAVARALEDFDADLDELQADRIVVSLADALAANDRGAARPRLTPGAAKGVERARDFLAAHAAATVSSVTLEHLSGLDRFSLARQFRARYGTSPHRYQVMRRLDRARRMIGNGASLATAAADCGFADQSHFSRHFRKAYGLSPGRWKQLAA